MSNEDFQSPAWADHHATFGATIHKLLHDLRIGFERLNAYEFDAPWKRPARKVRHAQYARR